jgi:hypothetical protein
MDGTIVKDRAGINVVMQSIMTMYLDMSVFRHWPELGGWAGVAWSLLTASPH